MDKLSIYRFNHIPPAHIPLAVRSAGHYTLNHRSPLEQLFTKWFCEVFWCKSGTGEFHLKDKTYTLRAGEVFYLLPGEIHDLKPLTEPWEYYWFTLDHKQSPAWLESFGFTERPFPAGAVPTELFDELFAALKQNTPQGDRQAAHSAHGLLIAATQMLHGSTSRTAALWVTKCREIIDENYTDPNLNINELAKELNVHRATLFRSFRQTYKLTPSMYLQNRRLHHAMELLKEGKLSVKEVAYASGITDSNYMTKIFRRKSGVSPREFRASYNKGLLPQS